MAQTRDEGLSERPTPAIEEHYATLIERLGQVMHQSLAGDGQALQGASHGFMADLSRWLEVLGDREEAALLRRAAAEYQMALCAAVTGLYRLAFAGLRTSLELTLQSLRLSLDALELRDWLACRTDTTWDVLASDDRGPLTHRVAICCCPSLTEHVQHYRELAKRLYRECSQYLHGHEPDDVSLPLEIQFSGTTFASWHTMARRALTIMQFGLLLRYHGILTDGQREAIRECVWDQLSHLPEVRSLFE